MGWSKKKTGKQPRFSPKKEKAIIDHFRAIRTFFPEVTRAKALEQIYEEDDSLKKIQPENREKSIQRLTKAYPRELSEEEANAIAPDPDRFFEDLDIMIHELIKGDS
jgi:NCAIR mutase (PurE)-related protein